jgi:hypothetical protein
MNHKNYIYEFLGFAFFFGIAGLIFKFDSILICLASGLIGMFISNFINEFNEFSFDKIVDFKSIPLETGSGELNIIFTILANYKTNRISIWACYTSKKIIDQDILSKHISKKIKQIHYDKMLKDGCVLIEIKLKDEVIELMLMEDIDNGN